MFLSIQQKIKNLIIQSIKKNFDLDIQEIVLEHPPNVVMGDIAAPISFELAKLLKLETGSKYNPRALAEIIAKDITELPELDRVEIAGAGYLNFFLKRTPIFLTSLHQKPAVQICHKTAKKIIVEHTSVNPNKAAHIGHVRTAVLGDTLVRLFRTAGEQVEVQNYIDNTGVQVADVVVGFKYIENKTLDDIKNIPGKFDYYCWDLYSKVGNFYEEDKSRLELRASTLHEIENGIGEVAEIAQYISTRIVKCHLQTMWRLGIKYDVLPCESEVLKLHFWDVAFERLKASKAIVYETEGRNKGCWVMPSDQITSNELENTDDNYDADKILVRSNGTVNYTGKDIAYHLWKLGQLNLDFYYHPFYTYPDGHNVWITSEKHSDTKEHPEFGKGNIFFNIIDAGQSYAQEYVKKGILAATKHSNSTADISKSAHISYEKVALTPASCEELGFLLNEEDSKRSFINMSGRKGLGVKADDLIEKLEASALTRVTQHQPELTNEEQKAIAHIIAVGALRYFILKYTRSSLIAFDFKEVLREEGETGVYLQYSVVRIRSIFRKLQSHNITINPEVDLTRSTEELSHHLLDKHGNDLWTLINFALRLEGVIQQSIDTFEPAHLAKYAFQLAQAFSTFYNQNNILNEQNKTRQQLLIGIAFLVEKQLQQALTIMGVEIPEKM